MLRLLDAKIDTTRAFMSPKSSFPVLLLLLSVLIATGCPEGGIDPVIEQYHQNSSSYWQAHLGFENFCAEDLWDPSQPCPTGYCSGALSTDTFNIDIQNSDDRDQIYFFDAGFTPDGVGIYGGFYGILFGDDKWAAQNPWPNDPDHRVMSIRYYDRGTCSASVPFGMIRRKILRSTYNAVANPHDVPGGGYSGGTKDISGSVRQRLNTESCGDPYVNFENDHVDFDRRLRIRLPAIWPPWFVDIYVNFEGIWRFSSGRKCVSTRVLGNKQGNFVADSKCTGTDPNYEWRQNQLVLENLSINYNVEVPSNCYIDPICLFEWAILELQFSVGISMFEDDLENDFHDAIWENNPQFEGHPQCQNANDCLVDPMLLVNYNDMHFDVRCNGDYEAPQPPQCGAGTEPYSIPATSNGCQLRPNRITRVNSHPDRIEVVFLEKGEGVPMSLVGLGGYHQFHFLAGMCGDNGTQTNSGNSGTGVVNAAWYCGNGSTDYGEECDGSPNVTCEDVFGPGSIGEVQCNSWCNHTYSKCCLPTDSPVAAPPSIK